MEITKEQLNNAIKKEFGEVYVVEVYCRCSEELIYSRYYNNKQEAMAVYKKAKGILWAMCKEFTIE